MIRINLLPFREARKKENIRRQISIYVLSILLLSLAMVFAFFQVNGKLCSLQQEKAQLDKELKGYSTVTKRIKEMEQRIKEINGKLEVIGELEHNKTGAVLLLLDIAEAVPRDRLWLNSLNERKGQLTLKGTAVDNETVALFMINLEKAKQIKAVDLKSSALRQLKDVGAGAVDFTLVCKTYFHKEKKPKKKKGHGRRKR